LLAKKNANIRGVYMGDAGGDEVMLYIFSIVAT
jgi:hypothetical protein